MKKKLSNREVGIWGEDAAAAMIGQRGWMVIGRNIRTPYGEIDLIGQLDAMVVFIEVKTRSSKAYGQPEEAITRIKGEHMLNAALWYIQEHPELSEDWRIDVISIEVKAGEEGYTMEWFENAVTSG